MPHEVSAFGEKCNVIFKDVTDNLFTKDLKKANTFLDSLKDEEANVPNITKLEDTSMKGVTSYSKMVDYYLRITRHCANMSELTINLAV